MIETFVEFLISFAKYTFFAALAASSFVGVFIGSFFIGNFISDLNVGDWIPVCSFFLSIYLLYILRIKILSKIADSLGINYF